MPTPAGFATEGLNTDVIPLSIGHGRRLFDILSPEHIELERTRILAGDDGVTHMHYRMKG